MVTQSESVLLTIYAVVVGAEMFIRDTAEDVSKNITGICKWMKN